MGKARVALVAGALLLALVACDPARSTEQPARPRDGGTLRLVVGALPAHHDPQRLTSTTETNLSRLTTRTLTTFRSEPGRGSEIIGDLASDTGRPSEGNRIWEFTLRRDVRWEDGSAVTCSDVKYGVERSFSSLFQVAQPYARTYLADTVGYAGPFVAGNNNGRGLQSVQCVDQRTVRFTLTEPSGDFGSVVAMTVFAPVPARHDTKDGYDKRPFANGPYKLGEVTDRQLTYVRNPAWDRATDPVRRQYPEKIVVIAEPDLTAATAGLVAGEGDWADAIQVDKDVAPPFVQQVVNEPELAARAAAGSAASIRYLAINTRRLPRLECRKALIYAFDKRRFRAAAGGAEAGDYATTMIPPGLAGHRPIDPYGSLANVEGQPETATRLLDEARAAGRPCPSTMSLVVPDQKDVRRLAATIVETYRRIGIELQVKAVPAETYWDVVGNPGHGNDLVWAGWLPDWPSGSAVIPPLFDGSQIPTRPDATNNRNLAALDDPEINGLIKAARAEPAAGRQAELWAALDEKIQARAVTVPILYLRALRLAGANVRGALIHPRYGQPDVVVLGLA